MLSTYFTPSEDSGKILETFTTISSNLKISKLKTFNDKDGAYSKTAIKEVEDRSTLKFIQPLLTCSVSICEANRSVNKSIIIAGKDELNQWKHIFNKYDNIGGVFNPILKGAEEENIFQEEEPMLFHTESDCLEKINNGNLSKWLFEAFITLPNFPENPVNLEFCKSCSKNPICRTCLFPKESDSLLPENVDKNKFIDHIWNYIGPT